MIELQIPSYRIGSLESRFDLCFNRDTMTKISEAEFAAICQGIARDRDKIVEHNPIGTPEEILLWMLLSVLISYLSLDDNDTPCFTGRPDSAMFRDAVEYVLAKRKAVDFEHGSMIEKMLQ